MITPIGIPIPIGDNFTMGIEDASYAINEFIKPKISVPIHYNTPIVKLSPIGIKHTSTG
jgi:L-ascorbate metabolism protein UlaG (beta-lactamase superfamily)